MKKAFLKCVAAALLMFSVSTAFAEESNFKGEIVPISDSSNKLAASNYVVDIVIDNYHDPKRKDVIVTPSAPMTLKAIKPNLSGRMFSESYPSEYVRVVFTYGNAEDGYKTFDRTVYRRVTIKINNPELPDQINVQEFRP